MAKREVVCPECGHRHRVEFEGVAGQIAGVRFHRTTANQFETSINVPGRMIEGDKYYTLADQAFLSALSGLTVGSLAGYFVSIPFHASNVGMAVEMIVGSALTGGTIGVCWLAKERAWQLGQALPAAVNRYLELARGGGSAVEDYGPQLSMDHRFRDGVTEAGRTIQYFGALPVDVDRFNEWARAALLGQSLAIAQWTGQGKPFSRQEYERLLDVMRRAGAVVNQPGKGNALTGGGRRALTRHLKQEAAPSPTPQERA